MNQPRGGGVVAVGLEKRRSARAESPVRVGFEAADGEPVPAETDLRRMLQIRVEDIPRVRHVEHHVETERKSPFRDKLLVDPDDVGVDSGVVHSREAEPESGLDTAPNRFLADLPRFGGQKARHEILRFLEKDPRRGSRVLALQDLPAGRIRRVSGDSRELERLRVDPGRVARHPHQKDGIVGRDPGQLLLAGVIAPVPAHRVPPLTHEPFPRRDFLELALHDLESFRNTSGLIEKHLLHAIADIGKVLMGVDEPRHHRPALEIHHLGLGPAVLLDFLSASDGQNELPADGDGLRLGSRRVEGNEVPVLENHLRGLRRGAAGEDAGGGEPETAHELSPSR
ncbi:MAG TPA: hypothetical protein VIE88_09195, partial [Vicinamibacteria bacterium]